MPSPSHRLEDQREWYRTRCDASLEGVRPLTQCKREKGHEGPHGDYSFEQGIQYARRALRQAIEALPQAYGVDDPEADENCWLISREKVLALLPTGGGNYA